jgi:hypothetical protein
MSDDKEFDPWELTSGLVDDADVAFKECSFGFRSDYNDGQTLLFMADAIIDGDDGPEESELIFPCGNGWEATEKGAKAKREDGKRKGFNKNSGYGLLISAATEVGAGDVLKGRGTPMEAAIWNGLVFHMKRKKISYGGDIGEKERLLPTEFKGYVDAGKVTKPTTKPDTDQARKAAGVPAASAPAAADNGAATEGLPAKLRIGLRKLAEDVKGGGGDHDAFLEKAFEMEGVEGNSAAENAVMADGADSIWAKAGS